MERRTLKNTVCDQTTAHCWACCNEEHGPPTWAAWKGAGLAFNSEANGRPVCPRRFAMGWKPGDAAPPRPPAPRRVPLSYRILVPPEVAAARQAKCDTNVCGANDGGICTPQRNACGGSRPASIAVGVQIAIAKCPHDPPLWGPWPGQLTASTCISAK